jgi:hypothetical protein
LGDCDVYLNVAGGLRVAEPAADLAVAAALVSSRLNVALPADTVYSPRRSCRKPGPARRRPSKAASDNYPSLSPGSPPLPARAPRCRQISIDSGTLDSYSVAVQGCGGIGPGLSGGVGALLGILADS